MRGMERADVTEKLLPFTLSITYDTLQREGGAGNRVSVSGVEPQS